MEAVYRDKDGRSLTRDEVHSLPTEQLGERSGIRLNIINSHEELYNAIAELMVQTILAKRGEKVTMILPVGPTGQYPLFVEKVKERNIDCRNLWTINMDEFLDRTGRTIPDSHPMSFRGMMMDLFYERLPEKLRMPREQMFFPRHDNVEAIDRAFDEHAPDGVDLCLAGVGPEGHFAFNEDPNFGHVRVSRDEFLADRTRLVLVNPSTVDMDALVAGSGDRSAIPPFAVTIGPHDVLRAKKIDVIFFAGSFQRYALREVLFREPTVHFPGTLLKLVRTPDGNVVPRTALTVWTTPLEGAPVTTQTI